MIFLPATLIEFDKANSAQYLTSRENYGAFT